MLYDKTWTLNPVLDYLTVIPHPSPKNENVLLGALRRGECSFFLIFPDTYHIMVLECALHDSPIFMFQDTQHFRSAQTWFVWGISTYHLLESPLLNQSCPPILSSFLLDFLWSGIHWMGPQCWLFLPQILTLITGKETNVETSRDQQDDFLQWRWQSRSSGERPPSAGMGLFPSSKGIQSLIRQETTSPLHSSFMSPTKKPHWQFLSWFLFGFDLFCSVC